MHDGCFKQEVVSRVEPEVPMPRAEVDAKALRVAAIFYTLAERGATLSECMKVIQVVAGEPVRRKRRQKLLCRSEDEHDL
jgi:hypothetical protein